LNAHPWHLLQSGPGDYAFNMALDEALLQAAPRLGRPVLRFYSWTEPAASFGYFQKYAEIEQITRLRPLVRRPTGGGLVPHDVDWTYSLAFPPIDDWYRLSATASYRRVHEWIRAAFTQLNRTTELAPAARKTLPGQCFQGHEMHDLLCRGRKIAGAAQRRTRDGLLIQGSVQPPGVALARADWQKAMGDVARIEQGACWVDYEPDPPLAELTRELALKKYSQPSYNRKR
jgi:lipoate-protein ligase A